VTLIVGDTLFRGMAYLADQVIEPLTVPAKVGDGHASGSMLANTALRYALAHLTCPALEDPGEGDIALTKLLKSVGAVRYVPVEFVLLAAVNHRRSVVPPAAGVRGSGSRVVLIAATSISPTPKLRSWTKPAIIALLVVVNVTLMPPSVPSETLDKSHTLPVSPAAFRRLVHPEGADAGKLPKVQLKNNSMTSVRPETVVAGSASDLVLVKLGSLTVSVCTTSSDGVAAVMDTDTGVIAAFDTPPAFSTAGFMYHVPAVSPDRSRPLIVLRPGMMDTGPIFADAAARLVLM